MARTIFSKPLSLHNRGRHRTLRHATLKSKKVDSSENASSRYSTRAKNAVHKDKECKEILLFLFCIGVCSNLIAGITFFVMDTNHSPAIGALPSFLFIFQELLDAIFLNVTQIFDHTHFVLAFIAFIKYLESFTRETTTFKTIL